MTAIKPIAVMHGRDGGIRSEHRERISAAGEFTQNGKRQPREVGSWRYNRQTQQGCANPPQQKRHPHRVPLAEAVGFEPTVP